MITPAKVDRMALQNASSVATILLTADCIVTENPDDKDEARGRRGRGYGWYGRHGRHGRQ